MEAFDTIPSGTLLTHEIEIKRSRFIATLARTDSPEEARALVDAVKSEHPQARHNCSAWLLRVEGMAPQQHSSDDGEPAGTAGTPMLEALRAEDVWNVTAVVTRYFGGVLLGAGGLVRAYSTAVSETLALAGRARMEVLQVLSTLVPVAEAGRIEAEMRHAGAEVLKVSWQEEARLVLGVDPSSREAVSARLASLTAGRATLADEGTRLVERRAS